MNINSIRTTSTAERPAAPRGSGSTTPARGLEVDSALPQANGSAQGAAVQAKVTVDERKLDDMVKKTNESDLARQNDLQFSVDRDTDVVVVKVVNRSSGEVLRQFPSEEMLDFMHKVDEAAASRDGHIPGLLFQAQG